MAAISKESVLQKTNYGVNIYSHILRQYYPDEMVMKIVGRDCGFCRNPFNNDKPTLHIWIEKDDPQNALSAEYARHKDNENTIPDGDAFSFAELHYKKSGDELLVTLNKEMCLHIGENRNFYGNHTETNSKPQTKTTLAMFSFFKAPISNTKPHKAISLIDVYRYIVGDYAKDRTEKLRAFTDSKNAIKRGQIELAQNLPSESILSKQARIFKAANFDYCTFSGTFTQRNDKALIRHSGLLCIDFDHLTNVETLFERLLNDDYFDTQLLFRSPSGDGLKWIIPIDTAQSTHGNYFVAVSNYISQTYGVEVDKSGRDISRACFLPHDPQAFINPLISKS